MKTNDLKIGDLVKCHTANVEIIEIHQTASIVRDIAYGTEFEEYNNHLEPIPLTKEILEKNGWIEHYINEWTNPNFANFHAWSYDKKEWTITARNGKTEDNVLVDDIKYVHELQHILWALNIDDSLII